MRPDTRLPLLLAGILLAPFLVAAQGGDIIPGYGWCTLFSATNTIPLSLTVDNDGSLVAVGYVVQPQPPSTVAFATRLQVNGSVTSYVQWQGAATDWILAADYSVPTQAAVILAQQITSSFSLRGFFVSSGNNERSIIKTTNGLRATQIKFASATDELMVTGIQVRANTGNDVLFLKLDSNSDYLVQAVYGSSLSDSGIATVAINEQETLVLSSVQGVFDGNANMTTGSTNFALTRLNGTTRQWTRIWGSSGADTPKKVAYDPETGMVVVVGDVRQPVEGQLIVGDTDVLVTCFDDTGNRQWTRIFGMTGTDKAVDVIIHPVTKAIYVLGTTNGVAEKNVVKSTDIFLTKLGPVDGAVSWTTTYASSRDDDAVSMVLLPNYNDTIFIAGYTKGSFLGKLNPTGNFQGFLFSVPLNVAATTTARVPGPTQTNTVGPQDADLSMGELIMKYLVWIIIGAAVLAICLIVGLYCLLRKSCFSADALAKSNGMWGVMTAMSMPRFHNQNQNQPMDVFAATTDAMAGFSDQVPNNNNYGGKRPGYSPPKSNGYYGTGSVGAYGIPPSSNQNDQANSVFQQPEIKSLTPIRNKGIGSGGNGGQNRKNRDRSASASSGSAPQVPSGLGQIQYGSSGHLLSSGSMQPMSPGFEQPFYRQPTTPMSPGFEQPIYRQATSPMSPIQAAVGPPSSPTPLIAQFGPPSSMFRSTTMRSVPMVYGGTGDQGSLSQSKSISLSRSTTTNSNGSLAAKPTRRPQLGTAGPSSLPPVPVSTLPQSRPSVFDATIIDEQLFQELSPTAAAPTPPLRRPPINSPTIFDEQDQ